MSNLSIEELKLMRDLQENVENLAMVQALDELIAIRKLKGDRVPVYQMYYDGFWRDVDKEHYEHFKEKGSDVRVLFTAPQKPASLPVGEIVTWSGTNRHMGITREVDFRFIRFDVMPGTKLYAIESESAEKSDLLTRAEALAVETRALANQIQAGE